MITLRLAGGLHGRWDEEEEKIVVLIYVTRPLADQSRGAPMQPTTARVANFDGFFLRKPVEHDSVICTSNQLPDSPGVGRLGFDRRDQQYWSVAGE